MIQKYREVNTNLKERYNLLASHYNDRLPEHIENHKKILDPFMTLLKTNFSNPRVVDLGCGVGLNSIILEKHGFDVTGLDYSENSLEHAKLNCPNSKFIHADFLDWNAPEKFHGVVAGSFLDRFHPDILPELFNKIDSLLVPKGYGLAYMSVSKDDESLGIPINCSTFNPYTALVVRDAWLQKLSENFKVVNYYEGYGCRDWFISIFQKR